MHRLSICAALALGLVAGTPPVKASDAAYLERLPEDEVIYFVLPDRFENGDPSNDTGHIEGGPLQNGFDPTRKGFYHGGDLKGLTKRLDYIQGLGATAIWLGPIYKNKPVQVLPDRLGGASSGYHGYWITDFTDVDPHFGTRADLKAFVDAAHGRGMKVYLDIITNHTADVIKYRECHDTDSPAGEGTYKTCPYRSKADYPWTTRGGPDGPKINNGFMGDKPPFQTPENFAKLRRPDYAYTPFVPAGEQDVKVPAWLNDMRYYHNRGDSAFEGESSTDGDFVGLDDLMTEDPRVVAGLIDIFKAWITDFRMDGFRVDTAKHVNPEFWQAFVPAVTEHAKSLGIPNFYVFAEATLWDPGSLAAFATKADFSSALDFPLYSVIGKVLIGGEGTRALEDLFAADVVYPGGEAMARALPVFTGNHDFGRFASTLKRAHPGMSDEELFARVRLAHALLFFARGVPVIYYGDEQGFASDGGDQDSREDMFASRVASYNDNDLIATNRTTAQENFDTAHPLYRAFSAMAAVTRAHEALRRGTQIVRLSEPKGGGLFAFSRIDAASGSEYLIVLNTGTKARQAQITVDPRSRRWTAVMGECRPQVSATGSYAVSVAALDFIICRSGD